MLKKKIKKGRLTTYAIFGLASVSLIAVGFSAWIIQNVDVKETSNITVNVAGTENQAVTLSDVQMIDNEFVLDAELGDNKYPIIIDQGNTKGEDLHVSFSFKFEKSKAAQFKGITYRLVDNTADKSLSTYANNNENYIVFPGAFTSEDDTGVTYYPLIPANMINTDGSIATSFINYEVSQSSFALANTSTYNLKVSLESVTVNEGDPAVEVNYIKATVNAYFRWGSKFGGVNPCRYGEGFNATLDANFEDASEVVEVLDGIKENIDLKPFAFEISHIPDHTVTIE